MSEPFKLIAVATVIATAPVSAHHSPIIYDRGAVVAFQATVSRFDWSNPHSYIYVETEDNEPVEWRLETDAIPILTRSGWTPTTLQPGDRITVRGRPDRISSRKNVLLMSLRTEDGTVLTSVPGSTDSAASASDLSGQWQQLVPWNQFLERFAEVELTEKALTASARYDPRTQDPVADCVGYPPPAAQILLYYVNEIEVQDDRVVMRSEFFDTERTVYTDGRGPPENGERTNEGHSIGIVGGRCPDRRYHPFLRLSLDVSGHGRALRYRRNIWLRDTR